jgi:hypothetical protein
MGEAEISMFGIKVSGLEVRNVCNRGENECNGSEELGDLEFRNVWNESEKWVMWM